MPQRVSQKTIVETARVLREYAAGSYLAGRNTNPVELLYEHDFPDWMVRQARSSPYDWNWTEILMDMRNGRFFFYRNTYSSPSSITGDSLSEESAKRLGEINIQRLAALAVVLSGSEPLLRSLQWDGFDVDKDRLRLVPLEDPVIAREEEDHLTGLVKKSGISNDVTILKHISDARGLYTDGKDHASLNESRSLIQVLIDGISTETDAVASIRQKYREAPLTESSFSPRSDSSHLMNKPLSTPLGALSQRDRIPEFLNESRRELDSCSLWNLANYCC